MIWNGIIAAAAVSATLALAACAQDPAPLQVSGDRSPTAVEDPATTGSEIDVRRALASEFDSFMVVDSSQVFARAFIGENCVFDIAFPDGLERRSYAHEVVRGNAQMTVQGQMAPGLAEQVPTEAQGSALGSPQNTAAENLSRQGIASLFDLSGCGQEGRSSAATPSIKSTPLALGESIEFDVGGAKGTVALVEFAQGEINFREAILLTFRISVADGVLERPQNFVCYLPDANPNMAYAGRYEERIDPISTGRDQRLTIGVTPPESDQLPGRVVFGNCQDALRGPANSWTLSAAQVPLAEGVDPSFAGTTWEGADEYFSRVRLELSPDGSATLWTQQDGMASYEELETFGDPFVWKSDAGELTIQNDSWTFRAQRTGSDMTGTATYVGGAQHGFTLRQK